MMPLKTSLVTDINRLVKGTALKDYIDKRIVAGLRSYFETISKLYVPDYTFSKNALNKACGRVYQQKLENIIKTYENTTATKEQKQYLAYCVVVCILTMLKLFEIKVYLSDSNAKVYGLTDAFLLKLQDGVSLIDDLDGNFDAYIKTVDKGDLRYIEMGLKRLLATQIDAIV
jgi:hypothetical protein